MEIISKLKGNLSLIYKRYLEDFDPEDKNVFYINGSQTLPGPLTPDEEEKILNKLDTCGEELGIKYRKMLVEHNLRLVVYIAKKFENTGVDLEDLISIGTIGLMKAINTFNNSKNIKLATYASRCIENEILMYLRRSNKINGEISIDEPLNQDSDGNELALSDLIGTDSDIVYKNLEEEVDRKLLRSAMEKLSTKEKNIMNLRFGMDGKKERTQKEVADMLGISQSYISRLEKKIMLKMRKDISSKTG